MNDIETLNKMISEAKLENDEVLVEYLTKALNHILEKQKQQDDIKLKSQENINQEENSILEENKETVIENKQEEKKEEKRVKSQMQGEVSTITKYTDGYINVESKYLDVPMNAKKEELITAMKKIAINLALDDATNDKSAEDQLLKALDKFNEEDDIERLESFLEDTAKVGQKGKLLEEKYYAETLERKELPYEEEYQKILEEINFVEIEDKENNTNKYNDGAYEDTIMAYQRVIAKIEALLDEAHNKMSQEKISILETKLMFLKERLKVIQQNMETIKEANHLLD